MRRISSLAALPDFILRIEFANGVIKTFDFRPYLELPVFSVLKNETLFKKIRNRGYFIEWEGQDIDLSTETLWHEGK